MLLGILADKRTVVAGHVAALVCGQRVAGGLQQVLRVAVQVDAARTDQLVRHAAGAQVLRREVRQPFAGDPLVAAEIVL